MSGRQSLGASASPSAYSANSTRADSNHAALLYPSGYPEDDLSTPEDREFAVVIFLIGFVALLCLSIGFIYLLASTQL